MAGDAATLVYDIDSSQAVGAAKALAMMERAAAEAAGSTDALQKASRDFYRNSKGQFTSASAAAEKYGDNIKALANEFNPVLAAQLRMADAEKRLAQAVAAGVVSVDQHASALAQLRTQYAASASAALQFGQSTDIARHHVMNLGYQVNDIGMMMALGQNPFALMMQQGPQVAQIFAQMNAEGRKLGPTIAGAFRTMLNPTTLVTLAVIGGAAALVQWGVSALGAKEDARKFGDQLSDLRARMDAIGQDFTFNVDTGRMEANVNSIIDKYGTLNDAVRTHILLLEDATARAAGYASVDLMAAFTESFDTGWLTSRIDEVRIAFNTTNDAARGLIRSMDAVREARGITAQRQAAEELRDEIYRMTGGIENMTAEQVAFVLKVNQTVDSLMQAETVLSRNAANVHEAALQTAQWASSMSSVLSYVNAVGGALNRIGGGMVNFAAQRAEITALQQGKTLQEASLAAARERARVETQETVAGLNIQNKWLKRGAEIAIGAANQAAVSQQEELARLQEIARERERAEASAGRSGGGGGSSSSSGGSAGGGASGGGGKSEAEILREEMQKRYEVLQEGFRSEYELASAEYVKDLETLKFALDQKLITQQEYETQKAMLHTTAWGSEYEQTMLQYQLDQEALQAALEQKLLTEQEYLNRRRQLNWDMVAAVGQDTGNVWAQELGNFAQHLGQMNEMAGGGYDKLIKAQKTFAAASALINAYKGASDVLAEPGLPWYVKLAAASKVLAAGIGFVSAIKSGGGGGKSSGGGSTGSGVPVEKKEPMRVVTINLQGGTTRDREFAEQLIQDIYQQSKDGRVIIARDR